jgi:hypothetical protein
MKEQADLEAGAVLFFVSDRSQSELRILPPLNNHKFANCALCANRTVDFVSDARPTGQLWLQLALKRLRVA